MKKIISAAGRAGVIICISLFSAASQARYSFDAGFFRAVGIADSRDVDLSLFNQGATFPAGDYLMSVYVNGDFLTRRTLHFVQRTPDSDPVPCLSLADRQALGIVWPDVSDATCLMPDKKKHFLWKTDMSTMRLNLTLPQLYLRQDGHFKTPWQSWQEGTSALLLNYNYNYSENQSSENTNNSQYLGLEGGLNLLGWRLRNQSTWSKQEKRAGSLQPLRTYVQKDYHYLQGGELSAGQMWSDGSLFGSVPLKGVMLSSKDDMLKSDFRSYTPTVQGVVNSQSATVTVTKNGRTVYQTTLPAGPFSLRGIMNNGGGDYLVQIRESDGSVRTYTQSADSLPELQTKGRLKYSLASGNSDMNDVENQYFNQTALYYGLTDNLTLYGGTLLSSGYSAYSLGTGWQADLLGAISTDVTLSSATGLPDNQSMSGHSVRASWIRNFDATATSFGLFAYRYSSESYLGFEDYLHARQQDENILHKKSQLNLSLVQSLGEYGNLSISGSQNNYWSGEKSNIGMGISHSINFGNVSLNSYFNRSQTVDNQRDNVVGLSITYSLYNRGRGASLNSRLARENGRVTSQNTLNLSPTDDGRFTLAASSGKTEGEHSMQGLQGNYSGRLSELSAGYYRSAGTRTLNAGLRGSAVVHSRGITLGRQLSMDSPIAIVSTPGVSDVRISNQLNVETDYFGNALVSNLLPYQRNQIGIDVTSLSNSMDVTDTDRTVVPTAGSVIPVRFNVASGERVLFKVMNHNQLIPMGALASTDGQNGGERTAFFADQGQVYLTGMPAKGIVRVKWGNAGRMQCQFSYDIGDTRGQVLYNKTVECR